MQGENLVSDFLETARRLASAPCWRFKREGAWQDLSWTEAQAAVQCLSLGLRASGVRRGDRVALISKTRYEWTLCDLAVLSLGAVTVPIYPSSTAEQIAYILENSGSVLAFAEDRTQADKVRAIKSQVPSLKHLILLEGDATADLRAFRQVLEKGADEDAAVWGQGIAEIAASETATIVYTSGTTGPPKGVVLTHDNFRHEVVALQDIFHLDEGVVGFLFLPLAHIFARAVQFWQVSTGCVQAYAQSLETAVADMAEVRPHFSTMVPRILEKMHEGISAQMASLSRWKRALLAGFGRFLVHRRVRRVFGGRLRFAICGGAPLAPDLARFFHRAGVLILEGYGLTETTAGIFVNREDRYRIGTVGPAAVGVEARIAEDGEILVKSPMVYQGYYKDPEATRQAFDEGGWFHTGDIGEIDQDGFLKITDRKKDLIITAAGKNIAPQNIENLLKTVPCISHALVYGDRRKFLVALVTLNRAAVEETLRREGIAVSGHGRLAGGWAAHPRVRRLVEEAIEEKNRSLAPYETVKRFAILENDFSQEAGDLTPTLKLRRKFVSEKYKDVIEKLYQSNA